MKGEEGGAGHAAISGTGIRAEPGAAGAKALRRGQTDVSENGAEQRGWKKGRVSEAINRWSGAREVM